MTVRNLYALLVGIDKYPAPVPALGGCVNDIKAIEELLGKRAVAGNLQPHLKVLLNQEATRQAIIDGFLNYLSQAAKDDVVLFYYSGHGSQERTPPEFWELEPDRLNETLVCYDSRLADGHDLADKEIARLLAHVAANDPQILVVLDCCHSGSGTRMADGFGETRVRHAPADMRGRPIGSFFVVPPGRRRGSDGTVANEPQPRPKHTLMAACRDDEEAKETSAGGMARGIFSLRLSEALANARAGVTYRDIFKRVNALVRAVVARQSPLIEVANVSDLDLPFLEGALQPHKDYFTVSFVPSSGWMIDGGAVHGIAPPSGAETTTLSIFPTTLDINDATMLQEQIGEACVTAVLPGSAKIDLHMETGDPDPTLTYRGVITSVPLPAVRVQISGDAGAVALARQAFSRAGPNGTPSLLIAEDNAGHADLRLLARADGYSIMRAGDERSLRVDVCLVSEASAKQVVERLEHIARWLRLVELKNPSTRLPADAVTLDIFRVSDTGKTDPIDAADSGADLRFSYLESGGELIPPRFKIRLSNNSKRRLYCMLLDLPDSYGVSSGLLAGNGVWLNPDEVAWAQVDGDTVITGTVPDELHSQGVTEIKDTLKVIASTVECDATLLDQGDLDVHAAIPTTRGRGLPAANTLDRLFQRVQTRHLSAPATGAIADWTTIEVSTTIVRPSKGTVVPAKGHVDLAPGIRLQGHSGLQAVARLGRDITASRDADLPALPRLPPWLVDDPAVVTTFEFSTARGGDAGLSTLELDEVADWDKVTRENPLVLQVDRPLAEDDTVLPVAFDGEFFLPLGWATNQNGATEIVLEALPQPLVNKRSLKGSIRIFFKKVSSRWLGTKYDYPFLALVKEGSNQELVYLTEPGQIRGEVQKANRIVVYVHGIIGDTRTMAQSAFARSPVVGAAIPLIRDQYDLVLAFDYENLNTPIEQTARDLKRRLADVGIGEGHSKELNIIAHSMGGLVSRWFIEREGGNKIVQHLIMLGTPNGGSPWPVVEDWVKTLISIGLNHLSKVPWPPTILGTLMRFSTRIGAALMKTKTPVEATLAEMKPGSAFLDELRGSADPGVRYSIIAGNTSLIPQILENGQEASSRFERLLERITPQNILHRTTALAFFGTPNDIAVSVTAISEVPDHRTPKAYVLEAACDHISYFITEEGAKALAAIQSRPKMADGAPKD
jgi:pimeloyl-ACP methyl ester carboxylesterase